MLASQGDEGEAGENKMEDKDKEIEETVEETVEEMEEREAAALKIQSGFRGAKDREKVKVMKEEKKKVQEEKEEGKEINQDNQDKGDKEAKKEEEVKDAKVELRVGKSKEEGEREGAALKIQSSLRGHRDREKVRAIKEKGREKEEEKGKEKEEEKAKDGAMVAYPVECNLERRSSEIAVTLTVELTGQLGVVGGECLYILLCSNILLYSKLLKQIHNLMALKQSLKRVCAKRISFENFNLSIFKMPFWGAFS